MIEDTLRTSEFSTAGMEASECTGIRLNGMVYRLESSVEIKSKAAVVAAELVHSFRISYAKKGALGSLLKNPLPGTYLLTQANGSLIKKLVDDKKNVNASLFGSVFAVALRKWKKQKVLFNLKLIISRHPS
jgi:hypothetical protein